MSIKQKMRSWLGIEDQPDVLKPGICECNHQRCVHIDGKRHCTVFKGMVEGATNGSYLTCACQLFIPRKDDGGDNSKPEPKNPEVAELDRMFNK